jgi:short-subunit dehydrogenase
LELERDAGVRVIPLLADLSDPHDFQRALAQVLAGPSIYGLILNAAVTHFGPYEELDLARFQALLNTNVTSVVAFANALIPRIEQAGLGGGVLFVSSLAGLQPVPFQSAYSGSKAFLIHYACGLWHELQGRNVSITTFAPGGIVTEMTAGEKFTPLTGWLMPVERCARFGLQAFQNRDYLSVPGVSNRLGAFLGRHLPRRFVTGLVGRTYRRALQQASRPSAQPPR